MDIREQIDTGLLDALPIPVAVFDKTARLIAFSPAYAPFTGLPETFLAGRPSWSDLVAKLHETRRLPEVANLPSWRDEERHRLGGLKKPIEERQYFSDGTAVTRRASPLRGGGFVLAYEDVSPKLAAERAANEAVLAQRHTLDHLADALAVFGADGKLKLANRAFAELWAWPPPGGAEARLSDFLATSGSDWTVAKLLSRQTGSSRLERAGAIYDAHHLPLPGGAVLLRYADVTDGVRLAEAMRARTETIAAADRMKSEFVATLADEARTPLATVAGYAEMLTGGYAGELTGRQGEYAEAIATGARHLASLLDDVFDLACIDAGIAELECAPFDPHTALAALLLAVQGQARARKIALTLDCPPGIGPFDGDERRIRQCVLHLLNNAIRHTPGGGRIAVSAKRSKTELVVRVEDTGDGIPRNALPRIAEPFVRTDANGGGQSGAGLGLALVRRFVELHGGTLEIDSQLRRGTKIAMRFPFSVENRPAAG